MTAAPTAAPRPVPPPQDSSATNALFFPEREANFVLDTLWGERGFPVDPAWIANKLGLKVVEMRLPSTISGALIKENGKDPVIVLEQSDSKTRKRFSCAHELGHYISRLNSEDSVYEYIDLRGDIAKTGTSPEEIAANKFAACLLMPKAEVKRKLSDLDSSKSILVLKLAKHFGVSAEAVSFRLRNLGIISN